MDLDYFATEELAQEKADSFDSNQTKLCPNRFGLSDETCRGSRCGVYSSTVILKSESPSKGYFIAAFGKCGMIK